MVPVVMPRGMRALFSTLQTSAKLSTGLSHRSKHAPVAVGAAAGILNLAGRGTLTPAGTAVEAAAGVREIAFCIRARTFASLSKTSARRDDYCAHAARAADTPVVAFAVLACATGEARLRGCGLRWVCCRERTAVPVLQFILTCRENLCSSFSVWMWCYRRQRLQRAIQTRRSRSER